MIDSVPIKPSGAGPNPQRPQLRAAGAFDRFGCARVDGEEKAGGVFLSPLERHQLSEYQAGDSICSCNIA
jgi:hypothetical protein